MLIESWFILGLFGLVAKSGYQIWQNVLVENYDAISVSQTAMMSCIFVLLPIIMILQPDINFGIFLLLPVASGFATAVGMWSFTVAMNKSDLSVVSPIQQTIPVFASIFEPIAFGTLVYQLEVVIASLVTVVGAYIVVMRPNRPFEPVNKLIEGGGPLLALATSLFFAISAVITSIGTQTIDLSYYLMIHTFTGFIFLSVVNFSIPETSSEVLGYGVVYGINLILSVYIISSISASRATIFFRISLIINVIVGLFVFSERHIIYRSVGSLIIILGVVISVI